MVTMNMEEIRALATIDLNSVFVSVFIILLGFKAVVSVLEWTIHKLGLETKWMRKKREEHDLIIQTSQNLSALQQKHNYDVGQSVKMQEQLADSMKKITENELIRDKQIHALLRGNKELLGAEIDKRYRQYIALDGIPESDVEEFDDIYTAYKDLGGNHSRDTKYFYVKNHLSVIPIKTKLVMD